MPFLAEHPDTGMALRPGDVGEEFRRRQSLQCPYCGDPVSYRTEGTDADGNQVFRAHFVHSDNLGGNGSPGGCQKAGESPEHEEWKMVAGELLCEKYGMEDFYVEKQIGTKQADVAIETPNWSLVGVAAEYQHKNKDKDYLATTVEYVKNGYAVHWMFNTDNDYDMLFTAKEEIERYCEAPFFGERNTLKGRLSLGDPIRHTSSDLKPNRLAKEWSVFFEMLELEWQYQSQPVELPDGGMYIPDFYLPGAGVRSTEDVGMWVELDADITEESPWAGPKFDIMHLVVEASGTSAALIGDPPRDQTIHRAQFEIGRVDGYRGTDWPMEWMKCENCGRMKYEFSEGNYRTCESCGGSCLVDHDSIQGALEVVHKRKESRVMRQMLRNEYGV